MESILLKLLGGPNDRIRMKVTFNYQHTLTLARIQ